MLGREMYIKRGRMGADAVFAGISGRRNEGNAYFRGVGAAEVMEG